MLTAVVLDWSLAASVSGGGGKGEKKEAKQGDTEGSWRLFAADRERGDPAKKASFFFLCYIPERKVAGQW